MKVFAYKQPLQYSHRHSLEKLLPQMSVSPEREKIKYWILIICDSSVKFLCRSERRNVE